MPFDADVIVVGGGPVGCAVALALAARGVDALVIERDGPGRDKVCGEGLLPHGVAAARRLGIPLPGPRFRGIRYAAGRDVVEADFPGGERGVGLRRSRWDEAVQGLVGPALRRGVRVTGLSGCGGDLTVATSAGPLRARLVVAADGARSPLRRRLGLDAEGQGRRRWAVRRHHAWTGPLPDHVEVHLLAGAELYLTPVGDGEVNVALLLEDEVVGDLRGDLARGMSTRLRGTAIEPHLGDARSDASATGPLRQSARSVVADGVVLAGDAAGFVDGITGEGMSLGLCGAEVLADVLRAALATGRCGAADLAPWARAHRELVAASHQLTELVLWGVRRRWVARPVVALLASRPDLFAHLLAIEIGEASFAGLLSPARWRAPDRGRTTTIL